MGPIAGLPNGSDFSVYYHAGQDILAGRSPYENPAFFYPPLVAFLMAPFALTGYLPARWIWFLLSHALLLWAGWLLWRALGKGRIALCCIACVWALGGAAKESLDVGQISPLLVTFLVIAYTRRRSPQRFSIGIGFALKYIPGILALPLVLQRRWRALAEIASIGISFVLIPWIVIRLFFAGVGAPVSAHYWMGTPALFSWSIPSSMLRLLHPVTRGVHLPNEWEYGNVAATLQLSSLQRWISVGTAMAALFVGVAALVLVCRGTLNDRQTPWAMAGLLSLSLAAAPVCWTHYQVLQYPGVAMLLASSIRRRAWWTSAAAIACFALVYRLPEVALIAYHDAHRGWTAASPVLLHVCTAVPALACLGLFVLALIEVHRAASRTVPERQQISLSISELALTED